MRTWGPGRYALASWWKMARMRWPISFTMIQPVPVEQAEGAWMSAPSGLDPNIANRGAGNALLVSVLLHGLLLSLTFGGEGLGMPGFGLPWQDRRVEAPDLRVRLVEPENATGTPADSVPSPEPVPLLAKPMQTPSRSTPLTEPVPVKEAQPVAPAGGPSLLTAASEAATPSSPLPPIPAPAVQHKSVAAVSPTAARSQTPPVAPPVPLLADTGDLQLQELARLAAVKLDAERVEAARLETQRLDSVRQDAARQEAQRLELARQEMTKQEAIRREAQQQAVARQLTEQAETARLESEVRESARQSAARQAAAQQEAIKQEAVKQAAAKLEAERAETVRLEAQRQAAARLAAEQAAMARLEAEARELARQSAARQDAARQAAAKLDAERAEAVRVESQRREMAQQAATRLADAKREEEAARDAKLRAIGKQLDEEAARRDTQASANRRGRIFGRADANAALLLYAENWSRKIQLNIAFDQLRELVRQPHKSPLVTVSVRSDGTVEDVRFVTSSGVPAIDDAIRRIVQGQAPYAAFPGALSREYDVIEIRRTWVFDSAIRMY